MGIFILTLGIYNEQFDLMLHLSIVFPLFDLSDIFCGNMLCTHEGNVLALFK